MLGFRALKTVTAAALLLGAGVVSASADATSSIQARQACMKANGGVMAVAVPIMKGENAFDKAALDAAFAKEKDACAGWADWWGRRHQARWRDRDLGHGCGLDRQGRLRGGPARPT